MHELADLEARWDEAARQDAFHNILSIPGLSHDEFWASGQREIDELLADIAPARRGRALDFGCGIGRLTQALARWYKRVDGVDISQEMLAKARTFNGHDHVHYHQNTMVDLRLFKTGTFDLVYSSIVLQHMPPTLAEEYVIEFLRVARKGGHVVFQLPDGAVLPNGHLSMYGTSPAVVQGWLGGRAATVTENDAAGDAMTSYRYMVVA